MPQARSNIPTIAEKVSRAHVEPRVRSYAYTEYDEKKPGYVSADLRAGRSWGALASALDRFYGNFNRFSAVKRDEYIEEGIAKGRIAYSETQDTEEALRNKRDFKQFIEENPEFANDNPWVEVGYEQSRLRELGTEAKTGLSKFLDEGGHFNQEDPAAFQSAINAYFNNFRAQAGLDSYEDKVLMAKWFSPVEAEARQSMTTMYDGIKRNGRQDKLANQVSKELGTVIDSYFEGISNFGKDPHLHGTEGTEVLLKQIEGITNKARENGLLDVKVEDVIIAGMKLAYDKSENEAVLKWCDHIKINGVPLSQTIKGAAWVESAYDAIRDKEAAASKKTEADTKKFMEEQLEDFAIDVATNFSEHGGNFDEAVKVVEEKLGRTMTDREKLYFKKSVNSTLNTLESLRETEQEQPENLAKLDEEVHTILAESEDPRADLRGLIRQTNYKGAKDALKLLTSADVQERKATEKFIKDLEKSRKTFLKQNCSAIVSQFVSSLQDESLKGRYKKLVAENMLISTAGQVMDSASREWIKHNAEDPKNPTLYERRDAFLAAQEQVTRVLKSGVAENILSKSDLYSTDQVIRPFDSLFKDVIETDDIEARTVFLSTAEAALKKNENPNLRELNSVASIYDLNAMFQAGITDFSAQAMFPYIRPETGLAGATLSEDGKFLITSGASYTGSNNKGYVEDLARQLFPDLSGVIFKKWSSPEQEALFKEREQHTSEGKVMLNSGYIRDIRNDKAKIPPEKQDYVFQILSDITSKNGEYLGITRHSITAMSRSRLWDMLQRRGFDNNQIRDIFYKADLLPEARIKGQSKKK